MNPTTEVLAAEWLKLRTVRSTWFAIGVAVLSVLVGALLVTAMTADFDSSAPADRAHFASADMSVVILPVVQFCAAVLAALSVTTEYSSGSIRPSLVAVPVRLRLLGAKVGVIAVLTLALGEAITFVMCLVTRQIVGDRPAPINPWHSLSDALPSVLAGGLSVMVVALVAAGIGAAVRSTAGALCAVTGLLFVLPGATVFLPAVWAQRLYGVMLPNLPAQLAGSADDPVLAPWAAAVTLGCYAVLALGAGALVIGRRDA